MVLGPHISNYFLTLQEIQKICKERLPLITKLYVRGRRSNPSKEKGSSDPDLYRNRAIIHQYLELYQQAIQDYKRAIELDPNFTETCLDAVTRIMQFSRLMNSTIQKRV